MPESETQKEVRRLAGVNVEQLNQRLREFAVSRIAASRSETIQPGQLPQAPARPAAVTVLPVRPAPAGPQGGAAPAQAPGGGGPGTGPQVIVVDIDAATAEYWTLSGTDDGPV